MTFTVTVHDPLAGIVPPEKLRVPGFVAFGVAVAVPTGHVVETFGTTAFRRLSGYVSAKLAPVIAADFGFVSVIVNRELALTATPVGENAFAIVGGCSTWTVALAALVFVPPLEVSPIAGNVLV